MIMAIMDYHSAHGDEDEAPEPLSPFADQPGPLTWKILAWRAGLILLLATIALIVLIVASWMVMLLYRR